MEEGRREGEGRSFYSWGGGKRLTLLLLWENVFSPQLSHRLLDLKTPGKKDMMNATMSKR